MNFGKRLCAMLAVVLSLGLASCGSGNGSGPVAGITITTNTGSIAGRITLDNGATASGVRVSLLQGSDTLRRDISDTQGAYRFDTLSSGMYAVVARDQQGRWGMQGKIDLAKDFSLAMDLQVTTKPDTAAMLLHGILTDPRDGKAYATTTIGGWTWLAQNLNYQPPSASDTSWCYNNSPALCLTRGRLYTNAAALRACPTGWHLPDTLEWNSLSAAAGNSGAALASPSFLNGSDAYGFSALNVGMHVNLNFMDLGPAAFWSSTVDGTRGYRWDIETAGPPLVVSEDLSTGLAVRCVKH